jgi:hypothetical protein
MCLKRVTRIRRPVEKIEYGWKVVEVCENKQLKALFMDDDFVIDKWMHDHKDGYITAKDGNKYRLGFHILRTRDQATRLHRSLKSKLFGTRVVRIKYKNVVAEGLDSEDIDLIEDCGECIVARSIMILSKTKRKKKDVSIKGNKKV